MQTLRRGPNPNRMSDKEAKAHYEAKKAHLEHETMRAANHFIPDVLKGTSLKDAYAKITSSYGLAVRDNLELVMQRWLSN